jgi:2'-5' RNA ligase
MRLFVAVELPADWHAALVRQQRALQQRLGVSARGLRWAGEETFHVTLLFLGDTPAEQEPAIHVALARATSHMPTFTLEPARLGTFGGRRPRMVWAGVGGDATQLTRLHERVVQELAHGGAMERFSPHVTLARVRPAATFGPELAQAVAALPPAQAAPFQVTGIALIQSVLRPAGPIYTHRFVARLGTD